jgi:hypothetical protein
MRASSCASLIGLLSRGDAWRIAWFTLAVLISTSTTTTTTTTTATSPEVPPLFEPTVDWKPILPNQAIPGGLDIHVDFTTGAREARLLPSAASSRALASPLAPTLEAASPVPAAAAHQDHLEVMKFLLRKLEHDLSVQGEEQEVRSLADALESAVHARHSANAVGGHAPEADHEVGEDQEGQQEGACVREREGRDDEDELLVHALDALADASHHWPSADTLRALGTLGVVRDELLLCDRSAAVRGAAAHLLGIASQNHPPAQRYAVEHLQLVEGLLRLLADGMQGQNPNGLHEVTAESTRALHRALFALSATLRQCPTALLRFVHTNGEQTLFELVRRSAPGEPLGERVLRLIAELAADQRLYESELHAHSEGGEGSGGAASPYRFDTDTPPYNLSEVAAAAQTHWRPSTHWCAQLSVHATQLSESAFFTPPTAAAASSATACTLRCRRAVADVDRFAELVRRLHPLVCERSETDSTLRDALRSLDEQVRSYAATHTDPDLAEYCEEMSGELVDLLELV